MATSNTTSTSNTNQKTNTTSGSTTNTTSQTQGSTISQGTSQTSGGSSSDSSSHTTGGSHSVTNSVGGSSADTTSKGGSNSQTAGKSWASGAVDADIQAAKKNYENGYTQSQQVSDTYSRLQNTLNNKPGAFSSSYTDKLNNLYDQLMNRGKFEYNFNADPMYQMYREQYTQQGKSAMQDTMGQAAALTGGYSSSYSQTAGQQTYQNYLTQLNDMIPELRNQAYQEWQAEGEDLKDKYNLTQNAYDNEYNQYRDTVSDWQQDRSFDLSNYQSDRDFDYSKFTGDRSYYQNEYWNQRNAEQSNSSNTDTTNWSQSHTDESNWSTSTTDTSSWSDTTSHTDTSNWSNTATDNRSVSDQATAGTTGTTGWSNTNTNTTTNSNSTTNSTGSGSSGSSSSKSSNTKTTYGNSGGEKASMRVWGNSAATIAEQNKIAKMSESELDKYVERQLQYGGYGQGDVQEAYAYYDYLNDKNNQTDPQTGKYNALLKSNNR